VCTCPDGQSYDVGDNNDACRSLACEGGTAGSCERKVDWSRKGKKVTCAAPTENYYRTVSHVGAWGGVCTCPDGQSYDVGDNNDACRSLACEGGTAGSCERKVDWSRKGKKVTCVVGGDSTPATSPPASDAADIVAEESEAPAEACAAFAAWPNVDGSVTCDGCTALVLTAPYEGRCDKYCESFGHVCEAAAEEVNEDCRTKYAARCEEPIVGTSDMLCTCAAAGAGGAGGAGGVELEDLSADSGR